VKLAIVSFGHADSILHYAKTLSKHYKVDLFFIFALNKRKESVLNFENEKLHTGFLNDEQVNRILGKPINNFISDKFKVKFFINYNLKIRSLKNIFLSRNLALALNEYDLIHFNGLDATLLLINSFLRKKRKVFTIHDVKLHSGERKEKVANVAEIVCKWLINSKHQIIIQNKSDYDEILRLYPNKKDKINLIPFKCLSIFKEFLNIDASLVKSDILFFGRISKYKGLKYLVDAIEIVRKTYPSIRVLIAGAGNMEKELPKIKINGNIKVINRYITNEEITNYIENTKIVVCPYTDATQSGVVMTSFAFGKPVIGSSVGGFLDVIEDNVTGLLVPPRDVNLLAEAIKSLLSNEKKINDMSKNIQKLCENGIFSWDSILNDVEKIYDKTNK
jgi:glycosyltransferase involved in cell wall biosynthesis